MNHNAQNAQNAKTTYLTTHDIATELGISSRTVQRMCRAREIPHLRVRGRLIRFLPKHVEQIRQILEVQPGDRFEHVDAPNPSYRPEVEVVVPIRRPPAA